jgi:sulfate permease, SulP family
VLALMPHATLAAVVVAYSVGLINPAEMEAIRRVRAMEFHWALVACLGVMVFGTLKGIVVAIVLSLVALAHMANNPRVSEVRRKPGTNVFRPCSPEHPEDEAIPGMVIIRPEGRLYFGNAAVVAARITELVHSSSPRALLLDCSAVSGLEYTTLKMMVEGEERWRKRGVELWLAALNPEVLDLVRRTPLAERLGRERMFFTVEMAVAAYEAAGRAPASPDEAAGHVPVT